MTYFQLIVLAIVQGIAQFLPLSAHTHARLVPALAGWPGHALTFDIAMEVGTVAAVLVYLWRDSWAMLTGLWRFVRTRRGSPGLRLIGLLIVGTFPLAAAFYALQEATGGAGLASFQIIAWTTLVFGLLLYAIDKTCLTVRRMEHLGAGSALIIGVSQILALLPGASRSGLTMTTARLIGYERPDAARFSMLLSLPPIVADGALKAADVYHVGALHVGLGEAVAAVFAFVAALAAIAAMMAWLKRATFGPLAIYRVLLGLLLLVWVYTSWFNGFLPPAPH